jgi:hypothetical protein
MAAVGPEEDVPSAAFVLAGATAWRAGMVLDLGFEYLGQKRREVDGQSGIWSGVAQMRCGARCSLRPVLRPRLRGLSAGLYGISGGLVAAASPRIVPSRARAVRGVMPSRSGSAFSHLVISSVLRSLSAVSPQAGRMNLRIRYSRLSTVLMLTSCTASHRSIHSLTVSLPAFGSVHRPERMLASWSRPQLSAAILVSNPDSLVSVPSGSLYFTRHGCQPFPRFSAYAMFVSPRLRAPGVSSSGHAGGDRLPGPDSHDVRVAETQVLADERARNQPRGCLGLEPRLAHLENSGRFRDRMQFTCHPPSRLD